MALVASICGAIEYVGSYPGEWIAMCELPLNHKGPHKSTYEWKDEETASQSDMASS